ncbi:TrkA C-terminal domain-containing protein [uncultured Oscillibacter sp.]|uniref:TrkA C-terminal domain-containing protein n=1 Tax=uncultured Oscillibacter sp. TaxID=876091 RepID=UPI0025F0CAB5|nr:TrkA C-terminal domain-containing protein [uncultured Oscillibacter sp.]
MREMTVPAQYLQIAADVASRVAAGDLPEGERLFGRSVMASEYGVSPETIRRALRMLADMKVIDVKPQSGAVVLSRDNARRYLEDFGEGAESRTLRMQLRQIVQEYEELNRRMEKVSAALLRSEETFSSAAEPLPSFEVPVPKGSPLTGRSIGALRFWQSTGGTVAAIRRGQRVILSPGPYAELYGGDVMILIGTPAAAEAARRLAAVPEETEETGGREPAAGKGAD